MFSIKALEWLEGEDVTSNSKLILKSVHNNQLLRKLSKENLDRHFQNINELISDKIEFKNGLSKLLVALPQCPQDILNKFEERWIKICVQKLSSKEPCLLLAAFTVISHVIKKTLSKDPIFALLTKENFIKKVVAFNYEHRFYALQCLHDYLTTFQHLTTVHKKPIEKFVLSFLSAPSESFDESDTLERAGRVFCALALPGGLGVAQSARGAQLEQLVGLGHAALQILFESVTEVENYNNVTQHRLPLDVLDELKTSSSAAMPMRRLMVASCVLENACAFIDTFLRHTQATFSIRNLIRFALRPLQVDSVMLEQSSSMESRVLQFLLSSIHAASLRLMVTLVQTGAGDLFLNVLEDQAIVSLKTASVKLPTTKGDKDLLHFYTCNINIRKLCYDVIRNIMTVYHGCHSMTVEQLMPFLLRDIATTKDLISLSCGGKRGGNVSTVKVQKKSYGKRGLKVMSLTSASEESSQLGALMDAATIHATNRLPATVAALRLAAALLAEAHHSADVKEIKKLQGTVSWVSECTFHGPHLGPYVSEETRKALVASLIAMVTSPHPLCPPNFGKIRHVLHAAFQNDESQLVRLESEFGLRQLTFICANPSASAWSSDVWLDRAVALECTNSEKEDDIQTDSSQNNKENDLVNGETKLDELNSIDEHEKMDSSNHEEIQDASESLEGLKDSDFMQIDASPEKEGSGEEEEEKEEKIEEAEIEEIEVIEELEIIEEKPSRRTTRQSNKKTLENVEEKKRLSSDNNKQRKKRKTDSVVEKKGKGVTNESLDDMLATFHDSDPDSD